MTVLTFFGCVLTAFGPPLAMFIFTIAKDPVRILVLILSAFFWLMSLLMSSCLWFAVVPLRDVLGFGLAFSILFQELSRILIYFLFKKADTLLRKLTENEGTRIFANKHILSYVVGLGYGTMSAALALVNVLADCAGPGTLGMNGESQAFFFVSALIGLAMILLHTAWSIIVFASLDEKKYHFVGMVWASHYLVSCLTLLNEGTENGASYPFTVIPAYLVLVINACLAFKMAGGSFSRIKNMISMRSSPSNATTTTTTVAVDT